MTRIDILYHTKHFSRWCVIATSLVSVFFPSSIDGIIQSRLSLLVCGIAIFMLMLPTTIPIQRWQGMNAFIALVILILFLIFTILSPFSYIAWGGLVPFLLMLTVLFIDVRRVNYGHGLIATLFIIDMILLILGFGTILDNQFILNIIENYYQASYEELFLHMVVWSSKPVTVFSTHSIAAFAYFALFCLNLRLASSTIVAPMIKKLFLAISIGYLCLIVFLMSNSAIIAFIMSIAVSFSYIYPNMPFLFRALLLIMLSFLILIGISFTNITDLDVVDQIKSLPSLTDSGFLARYTSGGRLQGTYDFLINNYLQPIGLTASDDIAFGDNFIALYVIKISIVGYGLIVWMLWVWLRQNLIEKRIRFGILLFFLVADLCYPLLTYPRVIGFLPLFALIWNSIPSIRGVRHA